ncbi:family 43 glycosylhydrolase [Fodinibius salsisoli]|uniref:Family 43 glycosylhydrolase n=1 Tax=Fodinibius salsisoli TaxID=2820877 RepID=A0ABT3PQK1_9BACT|nr:family 43 glycosylhydrolase [Fodinibius salsisoli]MCW9708129.1 family 43 glycosylhydrolase [Fodinibius salsisoli]
MRIPSYRLSLHVLLLGLFVLTIGCGNEQQTKEPGPQITNPVLPGDRPDPTVVQVGDTYWASATSNEWSPLFPIFKSTDLVNWELVTYVFPDGAPDWAEKNFWAPELSYDKEQEKMYAYYTARDKETGRLSVAVASAENPGGSYTDHGPLVSQELGSIDAYEARDKEGNLYMLWKEDGNSQGKPTPMWAQQISEDRTELLGEKTELFRNDAPWEGHLVEGISIFREGDYFYATYSAGSCCDVACDYKTGVARSKKLLGPWEKYDQNPVLTDNKDWKCLGHGSVVPKGDDFYFLYHAYSKDGSVFVGREAVLEKIQWTENNWPTFDNDALYSRSREAWDFSDDFQKELDPLWQWRVTQDIDYKTGESGLMVRASRVNQDLGTLLVQPTRSLNYEISATIGLRETGEDAKGGIALVGGADNSFGAPVAAIGISTDQNGVQVWRTVNRETEILGEAEIPNSRATVSLKMQVADGHVLNFKINDGENWDSLADSVDASPLVPWGMGFRFGMVAKGDSTVYVNIREFNLTNTD